MLLVVLGAIPCAMLVVGAGLERRAADGAHAQETAQRLAALASLELEQLVVGTRNLLAGLSLVPDVRDIGPNCAGIVQSAHARSPEYTVIGVARPDGEYVCSSVPITGSVNLADRRHFRLAVERRGFGVGDFVVGRVTGKASLNVGLAALDDAGQVQAVLLAAIDLDALARLAASANLPPGSDVTVLDRQGIVLTHYPVEPGRVGSSLDGSDLFRAIQADTGQGSIEATGPDGQPRLYAYAPLLPGEPAGPTVTVGIPTSVAYASADAALRSTLLKLGVVALLALVAAWVGGEAIVLRRVNVMLAATRRLAIGDLGARTGLIRVDDDLGELGQALDDMAAALQQRDRAHHEIERSLEESRQRLERESERLLTLHRVSTRLAGGAGSIDAVLDDVLKSAALLTGDCDGATIHLWDSRTATLQRAHAWGVPTRYEGSATRPGVGITGQIFETGEPIIVDDYQTWSGSVANAREGQLRSAFGVPLRYAGRRIGVLMIGTHVMERRPFTADDVRVVGLFADQAAAAIETARLYSSLGQQLTRLRALSRLNHLIFSTLDREAVLAEIAHAAAELMQVPLASVWVVERDEGVVRAGAVSGEAAAAGFPQQDIPIGRAAVGIVAANGEPLEIDDVFAEDRLLFLNWFRQNGLSSVAAIPALDDDGNACAVLSLCGRQPLRLTDDDRDLLQSFVAMAAVAIRNASLYQGEAQARQLAEQANHSKSEFLSRMSHELRTPLNAILGFAQVLEMSDLDPLHADSVQHILRAGKHLLGLIDEVLEISRIEVGRLALTFEPVQLSEIVPEIVDMLRPLAADRSITCHVERLPDTIVTADRQRLGQILLNLLTNAIKYNVEGGRVTVACHDDGVSPPRVTVTDTGPGIAPDRMARLFDPFDRLGAERTNVQGTGLGLAISKALAEAMGGSLIATSVVGSGCTFQLTLPRPTVDVERPDEEASATTAETPASQPARYVLYVEDDQQHALLVQRSLAWRPHITLVGVPTATAGLAVARAHPLSLILADQHLPDMSGADLLAQLCTDQRTAHIPVIIISADEQQSTQLLAAGARACLTRPFDVRAFLSVVDQILEEAS